MRTVSITVGVPDANSGEAVTPTQHTVHALLLVYADSDAALVTEVATIHAALAAHQVTTVYRRALSLRFDSQGLAREHFGFADGLSQPIPHGEGIDATRSAPDPWHGGADDEGAIYTFTP